MQYTHYFGSQFPENLLTLRTFKDVDAGVLSLVNQIKTYQNQGDYESSQALIEENKELLSNYMLTAEYINLLDEETRNIEICAKGTSQSVFYQLSVPSAISTNYDVWIGNKEL